MYFKIFYVLHVLLISIYGDFHKSIFFLPQKYFLSPSLGLQSKGTTGVLPCPPTSARSVVNCQVTKTGMKMEILIPRQRYYSTDLFYYKQASRNVLGEKPLC